MIKDILQGGAPILNERCYEVQPGEDVSPIIQDLIDTSANDDYCAGLSANQIGYSKRICVMREAKSSDKFIVMINPEIAHAYYEKDVQIEGCMSFENVFCLVERHISIRVRYLDENHQVVEREFSDWDARCIQHEIDHLDGVVMLEKNTKDYVFTMDEDDELVKVRVMSPDDLIA